MPKEEINFALLNRCELIQIIHEQRERIEILEAALSPGWGKWKFEDSEEIKKFEQGFAYKKPDEVSDE